MDNEAARAGTSEVERDWAPRGPRDARIAQGRPPQHVSWVAVPSEGSYQLATAERER